MFKSIYAAQGQKRSKHNLGLFYLEGDGVPKNTKEGIRLLTEAANDGYVDSQKFLGGCYAFGEYGLKANTTEARKWFLKACEAGDTESMLMMAMAYEIGEIGVQKNINEAKKWYRKAADLGDKTALARLKELGE